MATPSTFGSHEKARVRQVDDRGPGAAAARAQARSSSSSNALSRLIIGTRWRTSWKSPDGRRADRLGRRVGRGQLRVVRLELAQLHDEEVVLGVGDLGRVEHVVELVVARISAAQLLGPRRRLRRGRRLRRLASPRSGGDARADHGVGIAGVVERHGLARAPPAAGGRRSGRRDPAPSASTVQGTGRPCALTWATARAPAGAAGRPRSARVRRSTTDERSTAPARCRR